MDLDQRRRRLRAPLELLTNSPGDCPPGASGETSRVESTPEPEARTTGRPEGRRDALMFVLDAAHAAALIEDLDLTGTRPSGMVTISWMCD